jgi:hypothetical protein
MFSEFLEEMYCLHLLNVLSPYSEYYMEPVRSSETPVNIYQAKWRQHNPEDNMQEWKGFWDGVTVTVYLNNHSSILPGLSPSMGNLSRNPTSSSALQSVNSRILNRNDIMTFCGMFMNYE